MSPHSRKARPRRCAAFSLTEVTMATGIIAALALPLLAMLADSASSQGSARDRETAARIARGFSAAMVASPSGNFETHPHAGNPIAIPAPGAGETVRFFSFDADGTFLGEIDAGAWDDGLRDDAGAFHLLRLRLASTPQQTPELRGLCDLELIVAQPAAAAASARSQDHFLSRLVSP
jgi:hypothetical protein